MKKDAEWKEFTDLYHHVKSRIYYSSGSGGRSATAFPTTSRRWSTRSPTERNEEPSLYPFIASWNSHLACSPGPDSRR